jgi:hypothetical protein
VLGKKGETENSKAKILTFLIVASSDCRVTNDKRMTKESNFERIGRGSIGRQHPNIYRRLRYYGK